MNLKNYTAIQHYKLGLIDYENIHELMSDHDVILRIRQVIDDRTPRRKNKLGYYCNNVISLAYAPKWIGSLGCDVSYWVEDEVGADYSDIVGWLINELRYYDYPEECEYEEDESGLDRIGLYKCRLQHWFGIVNRKSQQLPRERWI